MLSDYVFKEKIGRGSGGKIYLAENIRGEKVAIKKIKQPDFSRSNVLDQEVSQEVFALETLNRDLPGAGCTDHILCYIESFYQEGNFYIVTEYIKGYDLEKTIRYIGIPPEKDLVRILRQIFISLGNIH